MTDTPAESSAKTGSSKRRRFLARFVIVFAICVVGLTVFGYFRQRQFDAEIDELVTKLDAYDSKWRWHDLISEREIIADAQNSARIIDATCDLLPENWSSKLAELWLNDYDLPPPLLLQDNTCQKVQGFLAKFPRALKIARKLKDYRSGHFPISVEISRDHLGSKRRVHTKKVWKVSSLLSFDSNVSLQDKRVGASFESALAMFVNAKSLAREVSSYAQLTWIGAGVSAVQQFERILAHGQLSPVQLSVVRSMLENECNLDSLFTSLKGELAELHAIFTALEENRITWSTIEKKLGLRGPSIWERCVGPFVRGRARRNHLKILQIYIDLLAIPRGNAADALAAVRRLYTFEAKNGVPLELLERIEDGDLGAMSMIVDSEQSRFGIFQCAICGLAAEEYRIKNDCWPDSLTELVNVGLLKKVPLDLEDGKPLRLRKTTDGLVIYSVGTGRWGFTEGKLPYEGNMYDDPYQPVDFARRIEFRLWNPDKRRQPAPPEKKPEPEFIDPPAIGPDK